MLCVLMAACLGCTARAEPEPRVELLVFAAASLTDVLQQIGPGYTAKTGQPVKFSFAASSALARQIEAGARADLFVSGDQEWMDYLQERNLIDPSSRRDLVGNSLVLIAPADSALRLGIRHGFALAGALGDDRLAIADPDIVPAGRYAKSALESLGVWGSVEGRLARAENVRAALAYVARGEAPLGIVYSTDAKVEPRVRVVDRFPAGSHPPIRYPAAIVTGANGATAGLLDYLSGPEARAVFERNGFTGPGKAR
jgi:molybdate transport system substrate-binding protein